jgi:hypothetical protein
LIRTVVVRLAGVPPGVVSPIVKGAITVGRALVRAVVASAIGLAATLRAATLRLEALLRLYPRLGTSSNLTIPVWPDAFYALTPLLVATALALPLSKGRGRRQDEADRQQSADSDGEPCHGFASHRRNGKSAATECSKIP